MPKLPITEKPYLVKEISANAGQSLASFIDMKKDDTGANTQRAGLRGLLNLPTGAKVDTLHENVKNNIALAWSGGRMFKILSDSTYTEITGAAMTSGYPVSVADFGDDVYFASGGAIGSWTYGDATASFLTDPDAPTDVVFVAAIDGYLHALTSTGVNYFSLAAAPTSWEGLLDSFEAESRPDVSNSLYAGFQEIVVGGTESVEYWYNTGDSTAPWQRIQGAVTQRGVLAPHSVRQVDNTWFFLDQDRKIIRLNGRDPSVISTEVIEDEIRGYSFPEKAIGIHLPIETTYVLVFPQDGKTWAYDYKRQVWSEWSLWSNETGLRTEWLGRCGCYMRAWGQQLIGSRMNGQVYLCSEDYAADGDFPLYWEMTTGAIDYNSSFARKICKGLSVRHKRGIAGIGTDAQFDVSYRNDGQASFTTPRVVNLGENGDTYILSRLYALGQYRSRQWKFSGAANVKVHIADAEEML